MEKIMTNEEFWKKIEECGKSAKTRNQIPLLIQQADKEKLSLLVVAKDGALQALEANDKIFAYCATRWDEEVPSGCSVDAIELDGLFFQLIDSGYGGLAFIVDGTLIGVEWSDLFPPAKKKKKKKINPLDF